MVALRLNYVQTRELQTAHDSYYQEAGGIGTRGKGAYGSSNLGLVGAAPSKRAAY